MTFLAKRHWYGRLSQLVRSHRDFFNYTLLPVLTVAVAVHINWWSAPYLSVLPPFLSFLAAIMVTTWFGGFRSAMVALALSAVILDYFFIHPINSFILKPAELATLGFFAIEAMGMAYCIEYLRTNEARLRHDNEELKQHVADNRQLLTEKETRLHGLLSQLSHTEERERHQLAAELHDYLAQLLTLARMKAHQARRARTHEETTQHIKETDHLLQKSLDYVQTLMSDLYPPQLKDTDLSAGLRFLARQMSRHGLAVDLSIDGEDPSLPPEHARLLYQSARELLMNIVKHAGVDRARVSLTVKSGHVMITVADEGKGFDLLSLQEADASKHFGLSSVHERMAALGGSLSCKSAVARGSTMTLRAPIPASSESRVLRAASSAQPDRVKAKSPGLPNQESLPL